MMNDKIQETRQQVIALMADLVGFGKTHPCVSIPEPSTEYNATKELLEKHDFNLVVCGKVKTGKSSLINAIIGKNILPVCDDVATSCAFKIINTDKSQTECAVVYANGDHKMITESQIPSYGSQHEIDKNGMVDISKTVGYIDIKTPIEFLPKEVNIIDTPGIGSNYPHHTAITKQFIQMADAAIFVINPTPIETTELKFLEEVLEITPNILLVMTKSDTETQQVVEEHLQNNLQKIKSLGKAANIRNLKIHIVSSTLLIESKKITDIDQSQYSFEKSNFEEVQQSLSDLIFWSQGAYQLSRAYDAITTYYQSVFASLNNQKQAMVDAKDKFAQLSAEFANAQNDFETKYGKPCIKKILEQIESILATTATEFNAIFSQNGSVVQKFTDEINALEETELEMYAKDLGTRVTDESQKAWNKLMRTVQQKVSEILIQYDQDCLVNVSPEIARVHTSPNNMTGPTISSLTLRDKVSGARSEILLSSILSSGAYTIGNAICYFLPTAMATAVSTVLSPVVIVLGVGTLIWGVVSGHNKTKARFVAKTKTDLQQFVCTAVLNCRAQLTETSLENNKYESLYKGFICAVRNEASQTIDTIYLKYKKELDAMKDAVTKSHLNPQILQLADCAIKEWQGYSERIKGVNEAITNID